jgi:3'-5' exoribonuclease
MEQAALITAKVLVRDLEDGQAVDSVFVVRELARRHKRNGDPFLKLRLGDASGTIEAVVWDGVDAIAPLCAVGAIVRVCGRYGVDQRYGASLTVRTLELARDGDYDEEELLEGPPVACAQMEADLRSLIATVQSVPVRALLERFFGEGSRVWPRWREAPAAKRYHQAYRHGLLEHCLSVAEGVSAMAATFPGIDRDVAVAGALLHDIGKIEAYEEQNGAIELSDAGRLQGEIALGYYMVRREIEELPGFPTDTGEALLHIVLSHHGLLEHGSPVVPCTREATLVHMVDNLGGRLGSFDRIERSLEEGQRWSGWDRALSGAAYFGGREVRDEAA